MLLDDFHTKNKGLKQQMLLSVGKHQKQCPDAQKKTIVQALINKGSY